MKITFDPDKIEGAYLKIILSKVTKKDIEFIKKFFSQEFESKLSAMMICDRLFLGEEKKPRNWTKIIEICSCVISAHKE